MSTKTDVFHGKNFVVWEARIKATLRAKDLASVLLEQEDAIDADEKAARERDEAKAVDVIFDRLDDARLLEVAGCNRPIEILEKLKSMYQPHVVYAHDELDRLKVYRDEDMDKHLSKFQVLASDLVYAGLPYCDEMLRQKLLASLPSSWKDFVRVYSFSSNKLDQIKIAIREEVAYLS